MHIHRVGGGELDRPHKAPSESEQLSCECDVLTFPYKVRRLRYGCKLRGKTQEEHAGGGGHTKQKEPKHTAIGQPVRPTLTRRYTCATADGVGAVAGVPCAHVNEASALLQRDLRVTSEPSQVVVEPINASRPGQNLGLLRVQGKKLDAVSKAERLLDQAESGHWRSVVGAQSGQSDSSRPRRWQQRS